MFGGLTGDVCKLFCEVHGKKIKNLKKVVKLSEIQFEISSFNQELLSVRSMKDVH